MPITTRRQASASASATSDFAPVVKAALASSSAASSSSSRRSLAPAKDSNIVVDLAAPLISAPSPFKMTRRAKLAMLSSKVAQLAASVAAVEALAGEEATNMPDKENIDASDREWAELNKPSMDNLGTQTTPAAKARARGTPHRKTQLIEELILPTPATKSVEVFTHQLNDVVPTPFKAPSTPNPRSTRQRRRSSTRGSALKASPSSATDSLPTNEGFGSGQIADEFDSDEDESLDTVRVSGLGPQSFTPSSFSRTRAALPRKSDRRSLHHTQLQLISQIVAHEEEMAVAEESGAQEDETMPTEEIVALDAEMEANEEQIDSAPVDEEQPKDTAVAPMDSDLEEVAPPLPAEPEPSPAPVMRSVRKSKAPVMHAASARKAKSSGVSSSSSSSTSSSSHGRKSLFEPASGFGAFVFHGVTPPHTPLREESRKSMAKVVATANEAEEDAEKEEEQVESASNQPLPDLPVTPASTKNLAGAITPRSASRRRSLQTRGQEEEQEEAAEDQREDEYAAVFAPEVEQQSIDEDHSAEDESLGAPIPLPEDSVEEEEHHKCMHGESDAFLAGPVDSSPRSVAPGRKSVAQKVADMIAEALATETTPVKDTPQGKKSRVNTPAAIAAAAAELAATPCPIVLEEVTQPIASQFEEPLHADQPDPLQMTFTSRKTPAKPATRPTAATTPIKEAPSATTAATATPTKDAAEVELVHSAKKSARKSVAPTAASESPAISDVAASPLKSARKSARKSLPSVVDSSVPLAAVEPLVAVVAPAAVPSGSASSPSPKRSRSKRSLVRVVAQRFATGAAADDIPDEILAQLFTRSKAEVKEDGKQAVEAARVPLPIEAEAVVAAEEEISSAVEAPSTDAVAPSTPIVAPSSRRRTRASVAASIPAPCTPARSSAASAIPPTPFTPFVAPQPTPLTATAMVESLQRSPKEIIVYACAFVVILGVLAYAF